MPLGQRRPVVFVLRIKFISSRLIGRSRAQWRGVASLFGSAGRREADAIRSRRRAQLPLLTGNGPDEWAALTSGLGALIWPAPLLLSLSRRPKWRRHLARANYSNGRPTKYDHSKWLAAQTQLAPQLAASAPPPAPSLSRQLARQTRSLCRASRGPPGSVLPAPVPPGERAMEYQLYPTH